MSEIQHYDFVIIGSGMGGGAAAYGLKDAGGSILILERGDYLKQEPENWDPVEVAVKRRYDAEETWYDGWGNPFTPRIYYNVGGNSKMFGGVTFRLREQDFEGIEHIEGRTVPWPFRYADLSPYYDRAEELLGVHGRQGEDPTEPPKGAYPHPPIPSEPIIQALAEQFRKQGLHPFHLPLAIDRGPTGKCRKGSPCDGYPCKIRAKGDAENRLIRPVIRKHKHLTLWTKAYVKRLITSEDGKKIVRAEVFREGEKISVAGKYFLVAAGAINSAALLLRSRSEQHPNGLSNASDLVGRNYMAHINSVIMAVHPFKKNPTRFQKTLALNDFYLTGSNTGKPLGHIQMRGKIVPENLVHHKNLFVRTFRNELASHSVDFWIMTEDLPDPNNRVFVDENDRIHLVRQPINMQAHLELLNKVKKIVRRAGYPLLFTQIRDIRSNQHQCGTLRCGNDPKTAVVDKFCRSFEVANLFVVDTSIFPSSGSVNPSLTAAANSLRVSDYIKKMWQEEEYHPASE